MIEVAVLGLGVFGHRVVDEQVPVNKFVELEPIVGLTDDGVGRAAPDEGDPSLEVGEVVLRCTLPLLIALVERGLGLTERVGEGEVGVGVDRLVEVRVPVEVAVAKVLVVRPLHDDVEAVVLAVDIDDGEPRARAKAVQAPGLRHRVPEVVGEFLADVAVVVEGGDEQEVIDGAAPVVHWSSSSVSSRT